ncbi:MAG: apolipoprotein N-acyltransferase [Lysobacterales bacterium]
MPTLQHHDNSAIPKGQTMPQSATPRWLMLAGILVSAVLLGVYAQGGWPLGFVALAPWLLSLNSARTMTGALLSGWLMSVAFAVAVFTWFGVAIGSYTGGGSPIGLLALILLAPILQPQVLVFALIRHWARAWHGPILFALAGACAWVACEQLIPKLLGDTLGHGLASAVRLRQVADLGGAAGITLLLILVNEALALAWQRRRDGLRALRLPLAMSALLPLLMAGYGWLRLSSLESTVPEQPVAALRIGMVQSGIVDYEGLRRELGTYAVVRQVLDTHFGLSRAAIEHHGVDALLWSETVYPTTFGHPRSEDGAALDQEILDFVSTAGVALVFGTYDLDAAGEYNAAAFVEPGRGLLGYYRKTHPFPLTEHVPAWLDGPLLRHWLPWTGSWQPGSGARVFPLRAADGRELQVLPLICLDDVHPDLAIDGARLGAQAIIGLSNDAWFSAHPIGARLHLQVASFRSIETRMPQLRVTSNGLSAYIDPSGEVLVSTEMGQQAVLAGELPVSNPPMTLMVRWGDWVGRAALALLLALASVQLWRAWRRVRVPARAPLHRAESALALTLLSPFWRRVCACLRLGSGLGLLVLGVRMLQVDGMQVNSLVQIQIFVAGVLAPAIAAWVIARICGGTARVRAGQLLLQQRWQRIEIPVASIAAIRLWRLPLPGVGFDLELVSGRRLAVGMVCADPRALLRALSAAGAPVTLIDTAFGHMADYAAARAASLRPWLDQGLTKFGLFPLVAALPAFRLHQHIAFGGTFGEYYTYGLRAWLSGLLIWWASWSLGLMLFAAVLRVGAECGNALAQGWQPGRAAGVRQILEWLIRLAFYLGAPIWLLLRVLGG